MRTIAGVALVCGLLAGHPASAQVFSYPSTAPTTTADAEPWYVAGEPITWSGSVYYPAGAQIHFLPNEMVRTGSYRGVPLFSRTTLEPYSVVFVPVAGGLMQPYERRREGDVAGTSGSTVSTLRGEVWLGGTFPRTDSEPGISGSFGSPTSSNPETRVKPILGRLRSAERPRGFNAVFVEFQHRRWYAAGAARPLNPTTMARVGERLGFAVYSDPGNPRTIYIPVSLESPLTVVPFTARR